MSTQSRVAFLSLIACIGCGNGDDTSNPDDPDAAAGGADATAGAADAQPLVCNATGTGVVNGAITGETVAPVQSAWYDEVVTDGFAIVVSELSGTCQSGGGTGESLAILLCDDVAPGTYTIVNEASFPETACPGQTIAFAIVEDETGADLDEAVSGSVTIDDVSSCVSGTYSIDFDMGDTLTGAFEAAICP